MTAERLGLGAQVSGLSGWRCSGCGAVALDRDSALLYALACDELPRLLPRKRPQKKKQ